MKKRFLAIAISFASIFACVPFTASAEEKDDVITSVATEYFEDGSYSTITVTEYTAKATASTKSGSKTFTYVSSNGTTQWTYKVSGTFSYTGSSATCTAVSDSYSISNSSWHLGSHSCSKSGNKASGTITMNYKLLGVTTNTETQSVTLTCSATGTLS